MSADIARTVAAGCREKSATLIGALERALGGKWQLADAGVIRAAEAAALPVEGPGLLMQLNAAARPVLLVLPDTGRLLPPWCAHPTRSHVETLARLAHEIGAVALLDPIPPDCCRAVWRENLADDLSPVIDRLADRVVLQFLRETLPLTLSICWAQSYEAGMHDAAGFDADDFDSGDLGSGLPRSIEERAATYSRSLLRIKVPVKVTLAKKKQPIGHIVELGPGAIIHFAKSCEEMLDLEVGGQTVAQGEPVKVGDKFGIRLTSLATPQERFLPLAGKSAAARKPD